VLALNLRRLRQAKGLSQEELAHQAEIDRTYVSALERSVYAAGIDVVDRLARVLGVEAADLLKRPTPKAKKGRSAPRDRPTSRTDVRGWRHALRNAGSAHNRKV